MAAGGPGKGSRSPKDPAWEPPYLLKRSLEGLVQDDSPVRELLLDLLVAVRIPNPGVLPATAGRLLEIGRAAPWLFEFLAGGQSGPLIKSLEALKRGYRGRLDDVGATPDFATLFPSRHNTLLQAEKLRAVYVLARFSAIRHPPDLQLSSSTISDLGSAIRGLDGRTRGRDDAAQLLSVASADGLEQIGEAAARDFEGRRSGIAEDWTNRWRPWIRRLVSQHRQDPAPAPKKPRPLSIAPTPRLEEARRWRLKWPGDTEPDDGEPEPTLAPQLPPVQTPWQDVPPSKAFTAAFSDQAIRASNFELSKHHIEVATDAEVRLVLKQCRAQLEQRHSDLVSDTGGALLLLALSFGRIQSTLADAFILPAAPPAGGRHLVLDLERGILEQPVLSPDHLYHPAEADADLFEQNTRRIRLPLPPLLREYLTWLNESRPAQRVKDWLGDSDPEQAIAAFLDQVPGLPDGCRLSARLRRWPACQLHRVAEDITKTMLLTGDTFGRSDASLHYYSPREADLVQVYRRAIAEIFEAPSDWAPSIPDTETRVGPAHVARLDVVKQGASQISKRLNVNPRKARTDAVKAMRYHNALTDYLAHYTAFITTHRPETSLFRLTRRQFDLRRHLVILQDKRVDPEHMTRLAASTPNLSTSLAGYLEHLADTAQLPWCRASTQVEIDRMLAGDAPLFQYLDADFQLRPGTTEDLKRSRPAAWEKLPRNWYRTFAATHLREIAGAAGKHTQPISILAQLGHLDAAGHPHGSDSLIAPIEMAQAVRPALIELERRAGFRAVTSRSRSSQSIRALPIRDWTGPLQLHERQSRRIAKEQLSLLRANLRPQRDAAVAWVLKTVQEINPRLHELIQLVRIEMTRRRHRAVPESLQALEVPMADIEELLARNEREHAGHDALRIAAHNRLGRWLRGAVTLAQARVMDIGLINYSPRCEFSPLLVENCIATEQMDLLREHLRDLVKTGNRPDAQCLRALALVTFDGTLEADAVLAVSALSTPPQRLPNLDGVLMVETVPGRRGPVAVTGLAALALGSTTLEGTALLSEADLSLRMASVLPQALIPSEPSHTLRWLCSTAAVALRIEMPGLIRYATGADGALDAPSSHQAAFFADAFPAEESADAAADLDSLELPEEDAAGSSLEVREEPLRSTAALPRSLLRRYRQLLATFGFSQKHVVALKPGAPADAAATKRRPKNEILSAMDRCEPNRRRDQALDIVSALADFARDMLVSGTAIPDPEPRTIYDHLSTIGRDLLDVFGGSDLRQLLDDDFEAAYEAFWNLSVRVQSEARAVRALGQFHKVLARDQNLPEVTVPSPPNSLQLGDTRPDPVLLSEPIYQAALQWLQREVSREDADSQLDCMQRRAFRAASAFLILLRRSDARISEDALLRHSDILWIGDRVLLMIRPSQFRALKTAAARRQIDLSERLTTDEAAWLRTWVHSEATTHSKVGSRSLVFPILGAPLTSMGTHQLRRLLQLAFAQATGVALKPHMLRHLGLTESMSEIVRSDSLVENLSARLQAAAKIRHVIGHARLTTSAHHYLHSTAPLKCFANRLTTAPAADRVLLAGLTGLSLANVDKIRQREIRPGSLTPQHRWITETARKAIRSPVVATMASPKHSHRQHLRRSITLQPRHLHGLLQTARSLEDIQAVAPSFGLSKSLTDRLHYELCVLAKAPTFFRIVPTKTRRGGLHADPRPRAIDASLVDQLLGVTSQSDARPVSELFRQTYRPSGARLDAFLGSESAINDLRALLAERGVPAANIELDHGRLRLPRRGQVGGFHLCAWALCVLTLWERLQTPHLARPLHLVYPVANRS